jgi:hypothetical protein
MTGVSIYRVSEKPLRQRSNFANSINADSTVQSSSQKYFALLVGQIIFISQPVPCPWIGAFRDRHKTLARDAVDALAHQTNAPIADGKAMWSRRLDAGVNLVTMLRIAPETVTKKPDRRGERGISR